MRPVAAAHAMADIDIVGQDAHGRDVCALCMFVAAELTDGSVWYHNARLPDRIVVDGVVSPIDSALEKVQALASRVSRAGTIDPQHWTRQPRRRRRLFPD